MEYVIGALIFFFVAGGLAAIFSSLANIDNNYANWFAFTVSCLLTFISIGIVSLFYFEVITWDYQIVFMVSVCLGLIGGLGGIFEEASYDRQKAWITASPIITVIVIIAWPIISWAIQNPLMAIGAVVGFFLILLFAGSGKSEDKGFSVMIFRNK